MKQVLGIVTRRMYGEDELPWFAERACGTMQGVDESYPATDVVISWGDGRATAAVQFQPISHDNLFEHAPGTAYFGPDTFSPVHEDVLRAVLGRKIQNWDTGWFSSNLHHNAFKVCRSRELLICKVDLEGREDDRGAFSGLTLLYPGQGVEIQYASLLRRLDALLNWAFKMKAEKAGSET